MWDNLANHTGDKCGFKCQFHKGVSKLKTGYATHQQKQFEKKAQSYGYKDPSEFADFLNTTKKEARQQVYTSKRDVLKKQIKDDFYKKSGLVPTSAKKYKTTTTTRYDTKTGRPYKVKKRKLVQEPIPAWTNKTNSFWGGYDNFVGSQPTTHRKATKTIRQPQKDWLGFSTSNQKDVWGFPVQKSRKQKNTFGF